MTTQGFSQSPILRQLVCKNLSYQVAGLPDLGIGQAIVNGGPLTACSHDASLSQDSQVLRDISLRQVQIGDQLAHRHLSISQLMEKHEALGVGQGLADTGLVFEKLNLRFFYHASTFIL